MNSSGCFVFRQRNLMSSAFTAFGDMRAKNELTDFKFSFGNRFLTGHRLVLAAAIPYFRTVFTGSRDEITLNEIDPSALESIIDFAYCGEINITPENARSLLIASKFLKLAELNEACCEFLDKDLCTSNAWDFRVFGKTNDCSELIHTADRFILENFEEFSQSESFTVLPFCYLKEIISRDDLNVRSEESVFEAVLQWVKTSVDERKDHLPELLDIVRMLHLPPEYLIERVSKEELIRTSILCRDLVDEAKLYHWMPEKKSKSNRFITRPRICAKITLTSTRKEAKASTCGVYAISKSKKGLFVKLLDMQNVKWIDLSAYESEKVDIAIALNNMIYLFAEEAVITFDVKKLKWNKVDAYHESLATSGAVLHHNRMYFFGGSSDSSLKMRCFDPLFNKWLKEGKITRHLTDSGVTSLEQFIYLTGGDFNGQVYETVEKYNPQTKEWNEISPLLSKRTGHGCTNFNGKIYVCGGFSYRRILETTEIYDPVTNQWNFVSSMKIPSWRMSFVPNNGKIYAAERRQMFLDERCTMHIYDPEIDDWELCALEGDPVFHEECVTFLITAPFPTEYCKIERAL